MTSGDQPSNDTSAPRVRIHRDGVTAALYTGLAGWAWFLYGFGAMLPLLIAEQGISRTVGGLHLTAQAVGGLAAGSVSAAVVRRYRRRRTTIGAVALVAAGLALLLVGGPTALTLAACLVIGSGGTLAVNTINPILGEHHGAAGPAAISEANAVSSGVGLAAPLAVGAGVQAGLGWRPAMIVVLVVLAASAWQFHRAPHPTAALDAGPREHSHGSRLPLAYWPLVAALMLCVAVEFSLTTWSADLLNRHLGLSSSLAAAGVSAVVGGMALGRLVVSRLALRVAARPMFVGTVVIALAGWLVLWTATGAVQAVVGLVLTGLGVGGHFPLALALILEVTPGREDKASSVLSLFIGAAIAVAPFALGALADSSDIHTAFLVVPGLLLGALGVLVAVNVRRVVLARTG